MKIYVSGLYCGGNPQPGVGIVRSLRQGYPKATLVGVEYTNRVSGIHWRELDDLWIQRPWDELDLDLYAERVREGLDGGALWISGSDLEAMWLATLFPDGHPNLLAPPADAPEADRQARGRGASRPAGEDPDVRVERSLATGSCIASAASTIGGCG